MSNSKFLSLIAFVLFASVAAQAAPGATLECVPEKAISAVRSGWNTLLAVESVKTDFKVLEIRNRYLAADDGGIEKTSSDLYNVQSSTGMFASYLPKTTPAVQFDSLGLGLRDINAPITAGPVPEGNHPATATLVLVTEFYPTVGAPKQIEAISVPLTCTYKVRYH